MAKFKTTPIEPWSPRQNDNILPSYERLQEQSGEAFGDMVKLGLAQAGITALGVTAKVLDTPRIIATDVLGNLFEGIFGFVFDLSDGRGGDAVRTLGSNFAEVFTDTISDIFTTSFDTSFDGAKVADGYYQALGTSYDATNPYVRWIPVVGFEVLQDPTTYLGVGAISQGLRGVAKNLAKNMTEDVAKRTTKYIARMNVIAKDERAKYFLSDVLKSQREKGTSEAITMMDAIGRQFGLSEGIAAAEREVAENLPKHIETYMGREETKDAIGWYANIAGIFGKVNGKTTRAAAEYVRRARSGYDDTLEALAKIDDEKLLGAGFTSAEIEALKNPIEFGGRSVRTVNIGVDDLAARANLLGLDMKVANDVMSGANKATYQEILDASRKYGGEIQFFDEMFDVNPLAHYWSMVNDMNAAAKNPNIFVQNIRTANNVARALGVGWYSNPFWYIGKMLSPVRSGKEIITTVGKLTDKQTYKTLFGNVSHPVANDIAAVFSDPLMGVNPSSLSWWERLWGKFMFDPNSPQLARISDEAIDTTQTAYAMVASRATKVLQEHGADIIAYEKANGRGSFAEAVQLTAAQRAAYQAVRRFNKVAEPEAKISTARLQKIIERVGEDGDLTQDAIKELGLLDLDLSLFADDLAKFTQDASAAWITSVRAVFDDVLNLESSFGVGTARLADQTSYYPFIIRDELYQHIEMSLNDEGFKDVIASLKKSTGMSLRDMLYGKVLMRSLRNLPLSHINEQFEEGGVEALRELGILDAFTRSLGGQNVPDGLEDAIVRALESYQQTKAPLGVMYSNPADTISKRIRQHYQDSVMTSYYGLLEQAGYVRQYETAGIGGLEELRLRKALGKEALNPDGTPIPTNQLIERLGRTRVGKGIQYYVGNGTEEAKVAELLGYPVINGTIRGVTEPDLVKIYGLKIYSKRRVRAASDISKSNRQYIVDLPTGRIIDAGSETGGAAQWYNLDRRINKLEARLAKLPASKAEQINKINKELDSLRTKRDALLVDASDDAKIWAEETSKETRAYYEAIESRRSWLANAKKFKSDTKFIAAKKEEIKQLNKEIARGQKAIDKTENEINRLASLPKLTKSQVDKLEKLASDLEPQRLEQSKRVKSLQDANADLKEAESAFRESESAFRQTEPPPVTQPLARPEEQIKKFDMEFRDFSKARNITEEEFKSVDRASLLRRLVSQKNKGSRVFVGIDTEAARRAAELGYLTPDGYVRNMATADFKAVFGDKTRIRMIDAKGREYIIDLAKGKRVRANKGGVSKLTSGEMRIQVLSRKMSSLTDTELAELNKLKEEQAEMLRDASDGAKEAFKKYQQEVADYIKKADEYGLDPKNTPKPKRPDTAQSLTELSEEFYHIGAGAQKALLNTSEDIYKVFKQTHKVTPTNLPKPQKGHSLVVSRNTIVDMIERLESAGGEADKDLVDTLYDMLNRSGWGFVAVPQQNAKDIMRLTQIASEFGLGNPVSQIPDEVLQAMMKINANIRSVSDFRPPIAQSVVSAIFGNVQKAALWGWSLIPTNIIGDSVFAAQGGISANVISHLRAAGLYASIMVPSRTPLKSLLPKMSYTEQKTLYAEIKRIQETVPDVVEQTKQIQALVRKGVDTIYLPEVKMTLGQLIEQFEASGITQGWVRSFYEAIDAGTLGIDWAKNIEQSLAKQEWYKRLYRGTQRVLSIPGMAVSLIADDSMRFVFAYDAVVNRGMTMQEASLLTKQYFGDFSPMRTTVLDKNLRDWVFFYKFKKWNAIQQSRIMARDPKWASFVGKVMRSYQSGSTPEELAVAASSPIWSAPALTVARKDESGDVWDRDGKIMRSQYALFNPFGSWYSPLDAMEWTNPIRASWESLVIGGDLDPSSTGVVESIISGINALSDSFSTEDPELKAEKRSQGLAHLTNTNRILRYLKPIVQNHEEWHRETSERLTRFVYNKYITLQDAVSSARSRVKQYDPANEENARIMHRLDRLFYQLRTFKQRKPEELRPFDL